MSKCRLREGQGGQRLGAGRLWNIFQKLLLSDSKKTAAAAAEAAMAAAAATVLYATYNWQHVHSIYIDIRYIYIYTDIRIYVLADFLSGG